MKKIIYLLSALLLLSVNFSCKKFLNVEPLSKLSGNNYWKNEADVESYDLGLYRLFREASMKNVLFEIGDTRCGWVRSSVKNYPGRIDFDYMATNNLKMAIAARADRSLPGYEANAINEWFQLRSRYDLIQKWTPFYKVIQAANIMVKEVGEMPANVLTSEKKKQYIAEAVFMRCISYFFLTRLFGDVPYYTDAYNQEALPRTNMVKVFQNCLADLGAVKNDLPWTYSDPTFRGIRAMRGGAIDLMMHMNMWCAGFDPANATNYYNAVDQLGNELQDIGVDQQKAYRLIPIEQTYLIMFGKSQEGLFEVQLSDNTGESVADARYKYSFSVVHIPFFPSDRPYSEMAYKSDYMKRIYPEDGTDKRKTIWFDENIYDESGLWQFYKFFNRAALVQSLDDNPIIFRLADAILLHAEALAELGRDGEAATLLNIIRARAGADLFPANPGEGKIKDAIFLERGKELMGEGHHFYDLVRTRRILDPKFTPNPLSFSAFQAGAWTWPIDPSATLNNPYMTLNNYWR
ncbi:hypothetical protein HDC90_002129 [Pedobacter sp. AK013]|uniref:RagB/SusD family nutrient uptake outer membrane protein n=1 Tax=Pedobacter sp. AK013 TaxID=2723071 RepID=UPI0016226EDC|nr:RagB/SusD family nutrient uptake outer membrane protein [Pedobacter sp. AK013]MBB6237507.1 hypothetical protein [Pedobacter sp. AK013]